MWVQRWVKGCVDGQARSTKRRPRTSSSPCCRPRSLYVRAFRGRRIGQCDLPELEPGASDLRDAAGGRTVMLRAAGARDTSRRWCPATALLRCRQRHTTTSAVFTGDPLATWAMADDALWRLAMRRIRAQLSRSELRLRVALADVGLAL